MDRIQETTKWITGIFGAIGGVLVAGVGFSSLGTLKLSDPRLWIAGTAGAAAILLLAALVRALLLVLGPQDSALSDLASLPDDDAVPSWFAGHPEFLQFNGETYGSLDELQTALNTKRAAMRDNPDDGRVWEDYEGLRIGADMTLWTARYVKLSETFRSKVVPRLLLLGVVIAIALIILVWAGNPPAIDTSSTVTTVVTTTSP